MNRLRSALVAIGASFTRTARDDRGDVPGWVLVTLMTAGLVVVLWAVAGPALTGLFENALTSVTGG